MLNREPDEEVSQAIEITNLCQALHCLPGPGGLLDQDAYMVSAMKCVIQAQNERAERDKQRHAR